MQKRILTVLISLFALSVSAESLTYPELNVAPLSSTRLQMEAKKEAHKGFFVHSPLQLAALSTIVSSAVMLDGYYLNDDAKNKIAPIAGLGVGIATLFLPSLLGKKKFRQGYRTIAKMPAKTKRQKLLKERMAEEQLREIRSFSWRMRIISSVLNMGALGFTASQAEGDRLGAMTVYAAIAINALPIILSCPWKTPMDKQDYYKKRIYGPIASTTFLMDPKTKKVIPGLLIGMHF